MIYLGLSLFLLAILAVARKPLYTIIDLSGRFLWRAAIGMLCLYAAHLTASFIGSDWQVPITYFTAAFAIVCGFPGVVGVVVLSFLI